MPVFQRLEDAIKTGFGQRLGHIAADFGRKMAEALAKVGKIGFAFNETLESAQVSLAAIYRQFSPDKFRTFTDAMMASVETIKELRQAATETSVSFEDLLVAYQGLAGAAFAAGIPMDKQVRLVVAISQAMGTLNIPGNQLMQEGRALLSGNIGPDAMLARQLGITGADVNAARKSGRMYEFISGKLAAFGEGAAAASGTMRVRKSNLGDVATDLAARVTQPTFKMASDAIGHLAEKLSQPAIVESCDALGKLIAFAVNPFGLTKAVGNAAGRVAGRWAAIPGGISAGIERVMGGNTYPSKGLSWDNAANTGSMSADPRFTAIRDRSLARAAQRQSDLSWANDQETNMARQRTLNDAWRRLAGIQASGALAESLLGMGGANLASRLSTSGTFLTSGAAKAWTDSLNISKAMLQVLKDIKGFFEYGVKLAPNEL